MCDRLALAVPTPAALAGFELIQVIHLYSKQDLLQNLTQRQAEIADKHIFNLKLSSEVTPVTNQVSVNGHSQKRDSQFG